MLPMYFIRSMVALDLLFLKEIYSQYSFVIYGEVVLLHIHDVADLLFFHGYWL